MKTLSKKGTTLISVVVAAAILGIALMMAVTAFVGAAKVTRQQANYTTAGAYAEGIMERERTIPCAQISSHEVTQDLPPLPSVAAGVDVHTPEPGLKEVTVTCSWSERGRMRRVEFTTLVAQGGAR